MFQLSAERVAALMNTDLKSVLARTKKDGRVVQKRIDEASKVKEIYFCVFKSFHISIPFFKIVKSNFTKLFGSSFEDNTENLDLKHWNIKLKSLLKGNDVELGVQSGSKRVRRSLNESLNESFLESFNQAGLSSLDEVEEVVRLRAMNDVQGRKLASMQDLFKKSRIRTPNSRHGGGSVLAFGKRMKAYSISMLCQGESSTSVFRSLKTLSLICPEILENEDGSFGSIPCRQTLDLWRSQIPALNEVHCHQFIETDEQFVIAVDASDVSNESLLNLGLFNSRRDYICLKTRLLRGKDHESISNLMHEMVADYPELKPKLIGIISDQHSAQLKANVRFAEMIGKVMGVNFIQFMCSLHSTKNQDENWTNEFPLAKAAVHNSMMCFGNRQNSENSRASLRTELEVGLIIENQIRWSPFKSNKGTRIGIPYTNAKALLEHRDLVVRVLSMETAKKNSYAVELRKLLTSQWTECQGQLGAYCIHWLTVINPYYSSLGKKLNLGQAKAICRELLDRNEQLVESEQSFDVLVGFITPDILTSHPFLTVITQYWRTADRATKQSINGLVKIAATRVQKKAKKDCKIVLEMNESPDVLRPMSNNYCEGSFAHIKEIHQRFASMGKEMKGELGQARQNHIGAWLLKQNDEDLESLLTKVANEWRVNREVKKRLKTLDNRQFYDSILNDE